MQAHSDAGRQLPFSVEMTSVILAWRHQHPNLLPERGSQSAGSKNEAENSRKEAEEQRKKKDDGGSDDGGGDESGDII